MKAKDYAVMLDGEKAKGRDTIEALAIVLNSFTREFVDLTDKRGVKTEAGVLACFNEIDQKYRAFCRLVSNEQTLFKPGGWRSYLQECEPKLWEVIQLMQKKPA